MQRSRTPPNVYRNDPYDQKTSRPMNVTPRGVNRPPQKRISESSDKGPREMSPKRSKPPNRNLQEVRRVDTVGETVADKVNFSFYKQYLSKQQIPNILQNYNFRRKIQKCRSTARKWRNRNVFEKSYYARRRIGVKWPR